MQADGEPTQELPFAREWGSVDGVYGPDGEDLDEALREEQGEAELPHDDFVVHLDDVLGARTGGPPAWRRVYPRRRSFRAVVRGGARMWLREHMLLVKAVGAALAVWILVGLASALGGQHARSPTTSVVSSRPARTLTAHARAPVSAPSVASTGQPARSPRVHPAARRSETPHLRRRRAAVLKASAPPALAASQTPAPPPAPQAPVSAPAAPAEQQTQGGLFSP